MDEVPDPKLAKQKKSPKVKKAAAARQGPAKRAAALRARRDAQRSRQITPAYFRVDVSNTIIEWVSKRRPPSASCDLPVAPLRAASPSCWLGSPIEKQN